LPSWLHYDAEKGFIEGVPTADDVGKTFQVEVTLSEAGHQREKSTIIDMFEIRVVDESSGSPPDVSAELTSSSGSADGEVPRLIRCLPGSAVTTATVIVDADLVAMTGADRPNILRVFGAHLELPVSGLRLAEASGSTPVDDGSALVAGAGNVPVTSADEERRRVLIQWEVGCGNVFAAHMSVLHRVETSALDGSMATAIGRGVVGWHVANKKPVSATRLRRQAPRLHPTATPTLSVTPPTRRPVPTTTINVPAPTVVPPVPVATSTVTARPTARPPRTRPTTTSRPTKPAKTTKERTQRPTTSPATTTLKPTTTRATDKLVPSVVIKPTTSRQTDVPTPPLIIVTKPAATVYPPLEWTGNFNGFGVSVNEIVYQELPGDAFRGGAPGHVTLELRTGDGLSASMSWLKLNQTSRRFYGMPMEIHVGTREYFIRATDRTGSSAQGSFKAEVTMRPRVARPAYESSATLDIDYDAFCENDALRLDVANKIAGAFGDPDARNLAITRVSRGSVVMTWTNSTMAGDSDCPDDEIAEIQSKMFNDNGTIRTSFQEAIRPYRILGVEMTKRGKCGSGFVRATPGVAPVMSPTESPAVGLGSTTSVDPASQPKAATAGGSATIIIVVLIVVAVVILVIVAVCCVCRRRNRKKSESPDKKIKPGAPIILAYELDNMESSMTPSKPLIGAGTERPPAPPDYQLATGANGATPPTDHRRPLLASDVGTDQMSPLKYQPPPGSATSRGQQPPGQRRVPPYATST
jgi:dystroglycan 1